MNALRCDAYSNENNKQQVFTSILQSLQKKNKNYTSVLHQGLENEKVDKQPLVYCHFANMGREHSYVPVTTWASLRTILTDALESHNELYPTMNLVLFEDAIQHVWAAFYLCYV